MLDGEEQRQFGADLRAGLPEELSGELEKAGEVVALVSAGFDSVIWWFPFGIVPKQQRSSLAIVGDAGQRGSVMMGCRG